MGAVPFIAGRVRPTWIALAAGALFAAIFVLGGVSDDPRALVTLLYTLPIALLAMLRGRIWGLGAAALGLVLFGVWDIAYNDAQPSALDYVARGTTFLVLGGTIGALTSRLREESTQSARFWELSTDLLCTAGHDGYLRRLNPAWSMLGWTEAELRSRPFVEFVHPDDRALTEAEAAKLLDPEYQTLVFENRYRCRDGSYRDLLWAARSPADHDGLIYASARDVTDARRAREQLRQSERFLDSVLENIPNMVFVKDAEQLRFVRFNHAGEQLIGHPREELLGRSAHDLFGAADADRVTATDREVLASDDVLEIAEEQIDTAAGTRVLHTRKIAIRDEHGTPRYLLGISEDITDRHLAERATAAARAEAERASQAKNEFLSRMSHELRTPLNAVIGFGQLLALDDLQPGQTESVEQILKAGRHLLDLINEVLDISRIESGTMSLSLEPVHLGSVLADALSLIRPLAVEAGVRLDGEPSAGADLHVLADQQRLKQVFINLLSNAVKYNHRGGAVRVRCAASAEGHVDVHVADTGRGMSSEQLTRLFEAFDRLGAEGSGVDGTGLGLSLSRALLHAMGATISAASTPGEGTTMSVRLVAADAPDGGDAQRATSPVVARPARHGHRTIVYVEDNLSSMRLVERLVARLGDVRLIPAMHGTLAIELARRHRPDLVLLDLHLPDLHGGLVLEQLKLDPSTAAIPVVVLSADATATQFERLTTGGAAGYLTKPIDAESLLHIVRLHLP